MERFWAPRAEVIERVEKCVAPGQRVLEIGPGSVPFSKATHFVVHPHVQTSLLSGEVSRVDVVKEPLPFPDKHFDFVYCRHVVEDLIYPDLLLSEMRRVGKAGHIETPSPLVEITRGVDGWDPGEKYRGYIHHKWIVWNYGGVLNLVEKAPILERLEFPIMDPDVLLDGLMWNQYFMWKNDFSFHRHEHDRDFTLQGNYRGLVERAVIQSRACTMLDWRVGRR